MKKLIYFIMLVLISNATGGPAGAEESAPLGTGNFVVKLDYILFTDDFFGDLDDEGVYIGIEGYGQIRPRVYLGGEIGQGANVELLGDSISFVPLELNVKYAAEITPNLVGDFGAGVSYSHVEIVFSPLFGPALDEDDWLLGGQFFADLTYKMNRFTIGINGKYQVTQDFQDSDFNLNNLRTGIQLGMLF